MPMKPTESGSLVVPHTSSLHALDGMTNVGVPDSLQYNAMATDMMNCNALASMQLPVASCLSFSVTPSPAVVPVRYPSALSLSSGLGSVSCLVLRSLTAPGFPGRNPRDIVYATSVGSALSCSPGTLQGYCHSTSGLTTFATVRPGSMMELTCMLMGRSTLRRTHSNAM